jgi:hypothetical protein
MLQASARPPVIQSSKSMDAIQVLDILVTLTCCLSAAATHDRTRRLAGCALQPRTECCAAMSADGAAVAPDSDEGASRSSTVNSELWTFKVPFCRTVPCSMYRTV